MVTDPVIGSFVWVTASLAFLAAAASIVRILDTDAPTRGSLPAGSEEPALEDAAR